jgi:NAD(P)-dependent dehydrogenase (short-subunit alcohol dehydrogenase family)
MEISFDDQVALVTGAAAGMGLATAHAFAVAVQSTIQVRRRPRLGR